MKLQTRLIAGIAALGTVATLGITAASAATAPGHKPSIQGSTLQNIKIAETNGFYRVGAPNLAVFNPVVETASGRIFDAVDEGTYTGPGGTVYYSYKLRFNDDSSICLSQSGFSAVTNLCSADFTLWAWDKVDNNGNGRWINERLSNELGHLVFLVGRDNGSQFLLKSGGIADYYYKFYTFFA